MSADDQPTTYDVLVIGGGVIGCAVLWALSRYDLRLALVEASAGKLGTIVDQIVLFCAGYDATTGRYSSLIIPILRIVSIVGLIAALGALWFIRRRGKWVA